MKVITIKQPWATLIAKGIKEYEFRTWKTKYRGPILIHAGKGIDKEAIKEYSYLNLEFPKGCIIAKTSIIDCINVDEEFRKLLKDKNAKVYNGVIKDTMWNGYAFKLGTTEEIKHTKINGKLSLWDFDEKLIK